MNYVGISLHSLERICLLGKKCSELTVSEHNRRIGNH
jgi:hypothetical protein